MKNTVYTKGFVNDDGNIEIPGVFFEDGSILNVTITVIPGKFEIAVFPSEMRQEDAENGRERNDENSRA